jgi:hypothetical protein
MLNIIHLVLLFKSIIKQFSSSIISLFNFVKVTQG